MEFKDEINVKGHLKIYKNGNLIVDKDNLIVNTGLTLIASRLNSNTNNIISHLAIGNDNTTPSKTQTTLISEQFRKAITSTTYSGWVVTFITNIDYNEANFVWKELGLFNASSSGIMLNRVVVNFTKTVNDYATVEFDITFSS